MAKLRLFPTRNPSARAAAHRAMAQAALFSDSSASTRLKRYNHHIEKARTFDEQAGLPVFEVYLARSGARLEIRAHDHLDALRRAGSPDACIVDHVEQNVVDVTFDPDCPTGITFHTRYGTAADALRRALQNVVHHLDGEIARRGGEA